MVPYSSNDSLSFSLVIVKGMLPTKISLDAGNSLALSGLSSSPLSSLSLPLSLSSSSLSSSFFAYFFGCAFLALPALTLELPLDLLPRLAAAPFWALAD